MTVTDQRGVIRIAAWEQYAWLVHGFSTRETGDFLEWPDDRTIVETFGASAATAMLSQVHSATVVRADRGWGGDRPEADATITVAPNVLIGVRTADCVPILLIDPTHRAVAAVHAGWRGTLAGVLDNAIAHMVLEFGSQPEGLEAAIGPAIGACCFEVGTEVADEFPAKFVIDRSPRPHVDLVGTLQERLNKHGIASVANMSSCTKCNPDRFHSHRANGAAAGRMLSVVGVC